MREGGARSFKNFEGMLPVEIGRLNARMSDTVLQWFEQWTVG
jgi:hypothetical protein